MYPVRFLELITYFKNNALVKPSSSLTKLAIAMMIVPAFGVSQIAKAESTAEKTTEVSDELPEDFASTASKYGSYLAARIASIDYDAETSLKLFEQAMKLNPNKFDLMRNFFLAQIANGHFEKGIELAQAINAHPERKLANELQQLNYEKFKKNPKSILTILNSLDPQQVDQYLIKTMDAREFKIPLINPLVFAIIALKNNDEEKALEELGTIEKKDFNLLIEHIKQDRPFVSEFALAIDAIKARSYDSAIKRLQPSLDQGHLDRLMGSTLIAWSLVGQKNYDEALKILNELKGPKWYEPFVQLHSGHILNIQGKPNEAIASFKQAVDNVNGAEIANQAYSSAILALATAYASQEAWEDALVTVEAGLGRYGAFAPMVALRKNVLAKKKTSSSVKTPQEGAALLLLNVGTAIDRDDNKDIAQIYMQMAQALAPKNAEILMELAGHYDREGATEQASKYYEQVAENADFYRIAQLEIALNYDQLKQLDKAEELFNKLIKDDPKDLIAYMAYGGTLARNENFEKAAKLYDEAVRQLPKRTPFHWNLYYRRGIANERIKNWEKAEKNFQIALQLYPDHPDVLNYLGYTWIDMGIHLDKGLDMIKKAANQRPNSGYIIDSLGWAYYKLGIYGKAVFYLEKALELEPADPTINDHLGDAYWHVNRKTEAGFQWNRALVLKPDDKLKTQIELKIKNGLDAVEDTVEKEQKEDKKKANKVKKI